MPNILVGELCRKCNRHIPPAEAHALGDQLRGFLCETCRMKHLEAWAALQQQVEQGIAQDCGQRCAECDMTLDQIQALTGKRSMIAADMDGVITLICRFCNDKHEAKRASRQTLRGKYDYLSRREFQARFYSSYMMRRANDFVATVRRLRKAAN